MLTKTLLCRYTSIGLISGACILTQNTRYLHSEDYGAVRVENKVYTL